LFDQSILCHLKVPRSLVIIQWVTSIKLLSVCQLQHRDIIKFNTEATIAFVAALLFAT